MKSNIFATLALGGLLLGATGCARSPHDRLQGRWLGESIENVPSSETEKATGWVKGAAMEFQGSKVTVTIPAETPRTGTFKVAKVEGDTMRLLFHRPEGGQDEVQMKIVGDQQLRWDIGGGREIVLLKAHN